MKLVDLLGKLSQMADELAAVNAQLDKARAEIESQSFDFEARLELEPISGSIGVRGEIQA